jgi:hypothetical protein
MSDMDNVLREIISAKREARTIATGYARTVAAWYQSAGYEGIDFAQFASTGKLPNRRTLEHSITREQNAHRAELPTLEGADKRDAEGCIRALSALRHYVRNPRLRSEV